MTDREKLWEAMMTLQKLAYSHESNDHDNYLKPGTITRAYLAADSAYRRIYGNHPPWSAGADEPTKESKDG